MDSDALVDALCEVRCVLADSDALVLVDPDALVEALCDVDTVGFRRAR